MGSLEEIQTTKENVWGKNNEMKKNKSNKISHNWENKIKKKKRRSINDMPYHL